jgi:Uma2 family endonuclease
MSIATTRAATAEDLDSLSAEGRRFELVAGELEPMSPVGGGQGKSTSRLTAFAAGHVLRHGLGEGFGAETGFLLARDPDTVLAPDWAFVRQERLPDPLPAGWVPVVPDLVLETRSPHDSRRKVQEKVELWLGYGVRVVWDADPARRQLLVHRRGQPPEVLGPGDLLEEPELLPGFQAAVGELF